MIGTSKATFHDIGKNLVAMMWKGANLSGSWICDNVPPEKFVAAVKEHNAQISACRPC